MLTTVLTGAMIAISFSAPPGPVAMETIRRGLRGGFSPALNVQLGSIIGDFMWFMLALIGVGQLAQIAVIRGALAWGSQRYESNVRSSGIPMPESVEDLCSPQF